MTLWIVMTLMTLVAALLIATPFLRSGTEDEDRNGAVDLAREQLKELDADLDRGLIGEDEAKAARTEIERRLLAAAEQGEQAVIETGNKARLIGIGIAAGWVVVGSALLYSSIGRPDLPAGQVIARNMPVTQQAAAVSVAPATSVASQQQTAGSVDDMIAGLASRLEKNPEDVEGWRMLGWSYFQTGNYMASTDAYAKAVALDDTDPVILSVYGEAMVRATGGEVTDAALDVFHKALAIDPIDPRARFFQGMALEQRGNPEGAIRLWAEILDTAPADADWAAGLRGRIEELAAATGFDLASIDMGSLLPESPGGTTAVDTPRGPTAADVAAAQNMEAGDRQAMILGMVEGLAARLEDDPSDIEGWSKLIRSYTVLNKPDDAMAALGRARDALGADSAGFATIAQTAADLGLR